MDCNSVSNIYCGDKMNIREIETIQKAGVIPYYYDRETPVMMFMVPSDPRYGGTQFQIAKGHIDQSETAHDAALREGTEELGLIYNNIRHTKNIGSVTIYGNDDIYHLTVYAANIIDPENFNEPHFETGKCAWLTLSEFLANGKANQLNIVKKAHDYILRADGRDQIS